MSTPRIDKLAPGTGVVLEFDGQYTESALFAGIQGEGDDRKARFFQIRAARVGSPEPREAYDWDAYRYKGRWVYGSSAQSLRLVSVNDTDL